MTDGLAPWRARLGRRTLDVMILKVLGAIAAIWLAFIVIGAIVHALWWLIVIGAIGFVVVSAVGWNNNGRKQLR